MSSNADTSIVMKYITSGASDFLIKPVRIEELKNIWQHVLRKQIGENRSCSNSGHHQHLDQVSISYPPPAGIAPAGTTARERETTTTANNGTVTDIQDLRKSRLSWTMQLHRQFIAAVNSLGESENHIHFPFII
jgi:two-component response regulator ARR-B family